MADIDFKKNSWHCRYLKFAFNIEPERINNLCPYFWLLVFGVVFSPVILLVHLIAKIVYYLFVFPIDKLNDYIDKNEKEKYNELLSKVTAVELMYCIVLYRHTFAYTYSNMFFEDGDELLGEYGHLFSEKYKKYFVKNKIKKTDLYDLIRDYQVNNNILTLKDLSKKNYDSFISKIEEFSKFWDGKEHKKLKMLIKATPIISKVFKTIWEFIVSIFSYTISFLLAYIMIYFITAIIINFDETKYILLAVACSLLFLTVMVLLTIYFQKKKMSIEKKERIINKIKILGLFGEYLKSTYHDYCPKINWNK